MRTRSPWAMRDPCAPTGSDTVLHYAWGKLYALSRGAGTLSVISRRRRKVSRVFRLAAAGELEDVAVVNPRRAYVTRRQSSRLLRVDLRTGATAEVVDLAAFADEDGVPDLGAMIVHQGRLFVQIRRYNELAPGGMVPPAYLAVIDLASEELIDVDPAQPGLQVIELAGTAPKRPMQIVAETRELFLSATGGFFDAGGIEVIDLDTLRSRGLVIREADGLTGADLGAFVMVTPDRGFLVFSTDLILSSHLTSFTLSGGVEPGQLNVSVDYFVPALVVDPDEGLLFVPDGALGRRGIHVFDSLTGKRLRDDPVPTAGVPTDLVLLRRSRAR